jgi:predicted ATP-dependent protease
MAELTPLAPDALYHRCRPESLPFETTAELADLAEALGQARAFDAVRFGIGIRREGFNLFVLGPAGIGKHEAVRGLLKARAAGEPPPDDWCYVNNFQQPHRPRALRLPAGRGWELRRDMGELVEELDNALPAAFESEEYQARLQEIEDERKERHERALRELREDAEQQEIALLRTPGGFAFAPMHDGEVLGPDEFSKLPEKQQKRIEETVSALQERLQRIIRQVPLATKEAWEKVKGLNREVAALAVGHLIEALKQRYSEFSPVLEYLDAVQQNVIDNVEEFRRHEDGPMPPGLGPGRAPITRQYEVNLVVDHRESRGAPIFYEDYPSYANLLGRVEHQAQMGALVTDFTLIKPGALHRANGGYLLLDAIKVLTQPLAWEGLKRALYGRAIEIESLAQMLSLISTVSLEPEPIPLDTKVVLMGDRLLYYLLYHYDPQFRELFKVAADFDEQMPRDAESDLLYARLIGTLARREKLHPFDRAAVARVIEHSSRLVDDTEKLSTHLGDVTDLLCEADHWARERGRAVVTTDDIELAIQKQIYRSDRVRERVHEAIQRGIMLIDTDGETTAQVNGLSVIDLGNFRFAQPSRITATVRLGGGEVVDIEREAELGGPIHSKGVLILSSFLAARYVPERPLSLRASLVFEQSYGMVEGDSASVGELCALLSALAEVPIRQWLAVTGSVNQHGQVQAIGGVNEKVEGFFDVCKGRGLTGRQGVVIPAANAKHLMLREDVVEAASAGRFHVYAVENVDQAVELLTGLPAGDRGPDGSFPEGTLNRRVEARLLKLVETRQAFAEQAKKKDDL